MTVVDNHGINLADPPHSARFFLMRRLPAIWTPRARLCRWGNLFQTSAGRLPQGGTINQHSKLGGGFKYFLFSPRKLGKIPILTNIFQMG